MIVTRFAPSPTGYLHLGHAASALVGYDSARAAGSDGRFLLRIEDIDQARCRPEFEAAIAEDLGWLGLDWERPVRRQSEHMADYRAALDRLDARSLLYQCFCTRRDIAEAVSAPHLQRPGPDGPIYPGICRHLDPGIRNARIAAGEPYALRLDAGRAAMETGPLVWHERDEGPVAVDPQIFGDVVLARKDVRTSYHLAVVIDDALQGITLVTRGRDLYAATHVHRLLQAVLGLPAPNYHHHALVTDAAGQRLAKRHDAMAIRAFRAAGEAPEAIRAMISGGLALSRKSL
ncbi:MAG: tRNA glutamyl-Q(34) synthetase GluQRS [Dongiaceae bacterium]